MFYTRWLHFGLAQAGPHMSHALLLYLRAGHYVGRQGNPIWWRPKGSVTQRGSLHPPSLSECEILPSCLCATNASILCWSSSLSDVCVKPISVIFVFSTRLRASSAFWDDKFLGNTVWPLYRESNVCYAMHKCFLNQIFKRATKYF